MEQWAQLRFARPTDKFQEVIRFYEQGLQLERIGGFENHNGYNGVMFGLPGKDFHLEFTEHEQGSPCPAPTKDNLLVFYLPNEQDVNRAKNRLEQLGYPPVEPENPYWSNRTSYTFEDPDGWRIVIYHSTGFGT